MTNKELKKLSRADLLEMMLAVTKENEQLRQSVAEMKKRLDDRTISIENCGSLSEAVLQINGVLEAAQAACEQYVHNIRERNANMEQICFQKEEEARLRCEKMTAQAEELTAQAKQQAEELTARTKQQAEELTARAKQQAEELIAQAKQQAQTLIAQAKIQAEEYLKEAEHRIQEQNKEYSWLTELLVGNEEQDGK